jgi:RNA polymerase sigma-70 factor (ECF subfamily)
MYKQGDDRAFRQLYELYSPGLFNYLVRLVSDWHRAEDMLVETFTKLARSDLDERGTLKAWLYRVATNQCYKWFRKNKRQEMELSEDIWIPLQQRDHISRFEREIKVQKMLHRLSDQHRVVIIMKFYNEMSYQEIADVLCIPLGTVKSRMHEAMKALRRSHELP